MAVESIARLPGSGDSEKNRTDLEGLESFFEDDCLEIYTRGLSLKQAVFYYGDTRRSIRKRVLQGSIPAIRLPEAYGKKWRIFPDGVPPQLRELVPDKLKKKSNPEEQTAEPAAAETKEAENEAAVLDFSVPGIDCPGQLILKAAGFMVEDPAAAAEITPALEELPPPVEQTPSPATAPEAELLLAQPTQETAAMRALLQSLETTDPHLLLESIDQLEKKLTDANYRNSYLETRLSALEDQVRFLTQAHCQKRNFNELILVIPALLLLAAIVFFRFSAALHF